LFRWSRLSVSLGRASLEPAAMPAGRLEVNVLDGTRLKDTQTFGKQDPYCVLRVGEQRDRTKTCTNGGTRPRWNERFNFSLAGHESALDLEVWNANTMTSDAYIGAALVSLGDVFASGTQDASVPLRDKKNKIAGNVMLVLRFAPADAGATPSHANHAQNAPYQQQQATHHAQQNAPQYVTPTPPPMAYQPTAPLTAYQPTAPPMAYAAPAPLPTRPPQPAYPHGQNHTPYGNASPYPSVPRDGANDGWFDNAPPPAAPPYGQQPYARGPPPPANGDGWF
jgi:hypothetical protein